MHKGTCLVISGNTSLASATVASKDISSVASRRLSAINKYSNLNDNALLG
jgi:hypothetical protein